MHLLFWSALLLFFSQFLLYLTAAFLIGDTIQAEKVTDRGAELCPGTYKPKRRRMNKKNARSANWRVHAKTGHRKSSVAKVFSRH
jgi:hypothetical protein